MPNERGPDKPTPTPTPAERGPAAPQPETVSGAPISMAPGQEYPVAQVDELKQQLEKLQARVDHQRELSSARKQRYRERHPEKVKKYNADYMRNWRARK